MFLSVGFFALFWVFGNLDYSTVFSLSPFMNESALTVIGLLLLLAAMGKSAQLGLHTWLPDAMEGWYYISTLLVAFVLLRLSALDISFMSLTYDITIVANTIPAVLLTVPRSTLETFTGNMHFSFPVFQAGNENMTVLFGIPTFLFLNEKSLRMIKK